MLFKFRQQIQRMDVSQLFIAGSFILVSAWLVIIKGLMVTDVWDESNFLRVLNGPPIAGFSLSGLNIIEKLAFLWTNYVTFYRPLAASLAVILVSLGASFEQLRYVNAALLASSIYMLAYALLRYFSVSLPRVLGFEALALGSSAAIITAGWFANIFDASCLFLISIGFLLLLRNSGLSAGILMGLAFYCKETTVLVFPFLFFCYSSGNVQGRTLAVSMLSLLLFALIYSVVREKMVALGSSADIHSFEIAAFWISTQVFLQSFWWQHTKFTSVSIWAYSGWFFLACSLIGIRGFRYQLLASLILLLAAVIYWGMFGYQRDQVITYHNFVGRLYLIPSVFLLFLLAVKGRNGMLIILAIPLLVGASMTFSDHLRFQRLYADIYLQAAQQKGTLLVYYPEKPLDDPIRRLRIGNFPDAPLRIDTLKGILESNH